MAQLTRRAVVASLAAVYAVPLAACDRSQHMGTENPIADGLDVRGVAAIAESYEAATGDPVSEEVRPALFPLGFADPVALKAAAAKDFAAGRVFVHAGWRLSYTEGRLFTILLRLSA